MRDASKTSHCADLKGIAGATLALPVLEAMGQEVAGQIPPRYRVRGAGWNA